jgi:hypothetical protein
MAKAQGSVAYSDSLKPAVGATVKAVKDQTVETQVTNASGEFSFEDLEAGEWDFSASLAGFRPSGTEKLDPSQSDTKISLFLTTWASDSDQEAGKKFFTGILIGLLVLIVVYVLLHFFIPPNTTPLNPSLVDLFGRIETRLSASSEPATDQVLKGLTTGLSGVVDSATATTTRLSAVDKQVAVRLAETITLAVTSGQKDAALDELNSLRRLIQAPPVSRFQFWGDVPLRFLEIILWGLAGILVSKIILVGWYLRRRSFYSQGIVMHISHIAATPLLVLVSVLILSLVTLKVTLAGGNEINIDLSDPNIMVAFAFIIGTSPWPLWRFIEVSARRFTGQLEDSAGAK